MKGFRHILNVLLLSATGSYAQDTCHASPLMKKVYIEPLALIDIYGGPSIRLGMEMPIGCATSTFATVGYYGNGYYLKGGFKHYIKRSKDGIFLAISVFYKDESHTVYDYIRIYDSLSHEQQGPSLNYGIHKKAYGANVEIGGEAFRHKHWAMEWYAGVGARIKTSTNSIPDSVQHTLFHYNESMIERFITSSASNQLTASLSFGLRFGYVFRAHKKM